MGPGRRLRDRVSLFTAFARRGHVTRDLIRIRCERGAAVARQFRFPQATESTIAALDEHWDGGGHPHGVRGDAIPLLARIANIAQNLEMAHDKCDTDVAMSLA